MLAVTVGEVFSAYKANEARANATYKKQKLQVLFNVDEIEDQYVVQNLGFLESAHLRFSQDELVKFNVGDNTSRVCKLEGFELDILLRFDCR